MSGLYTNHDNKIYFEGIRYGITKLQSLVDFCSDRIRICESKFHTHIGGVNYNGIAGLILAVDGYAESLLTCCFVRHTTVGTGVECFIESVQDLLWSLYQSFFCVDHSNPNPNSNSRNRNRNQNRISNLEIIQKNMIKSQKSQNKLHFLLSECEMNCMSESVKNNISALLASVCSNV